LNSGYQLIAHLGLADHTIEHFLDLQLMFTFAALIKQSPKSPEAILGIYNK